MKVAAQADVTKTRQIAQGVRAEPSRRTGALRQLESDEPASVAADIESPRETYRLGRTPIQSPDGRQTAALAADQPPTPAPRLIEGHPAAALSGASAAGAELSGTPAQIHEQLSALPPSVQADAYLGLGAAIDTSLGAAGTAAALSVPALSATLQGESAQAPAPSVSAPTSAPPALPALEQRDPVPDVPGLPEPALVQRPSLPTDFPGAASGQAAPDPGVVGDVLISIDQAPSLPTSLERPEIPLEGSADPAQLDGVTSAARGETGALLAEAKAGVGAIGDDVVQPVAVEQTVVAAPLAPVTPLEAAPQVAGMDKLASYRLGPVDRAAFDAQTAPELQKANAHLGGELDAHEQTLDAERDRVLGEASAAADAAQSEAETQRQTEVAGAREQLAGEQARVEDAQQSAADGALADLTSERDRQSAAIDQRVAADHATIDATYARAEQDAQAKVDAGTEQADRARSEAGAKSESQSWWEWTIDAWQSFVRAFADRVIAIWREVNDGVRSLLDGAIAIASEIVHAAVGFVKQVLSKYFDLYRGLIADLIGNVFPALAEQLTAWLDAWQKAVFSALDTIADAYVAALHAIADGIVAGLNAGLEAYRTGVAAYLAVWEAIQQGQWAELGTMLLTGLLIAAGIPPADFFATFVKVGEIVDAISKDPTVVVVNAIGALSLGFELFGEHFLDHFLAASVEWLTGATGIHMPASFDLAGLFDVVCQVLGLTYDHLRAKAVEHVGEGAVAAAEQLFGAIRAFVADGWSGLWTYVKDGLTSLIDDVVMTIGTWLTEKAIFVFGRWVAGLAATLGISAIVEGLIALWQFVMWLKDQFQRFWQIIKATVDSVHEFVTGNIQPAAETIEATLQNLIPPAIDLIAKLLEIGNIPAKVEEVVESVRHVVDDAIDKVFDMLLKTLGLRRDAKVEEGSEASEAEEHGVSLEMLEEAPGVGERSAEEKQHDLETATAVLELARHKVEDTAALAEYFEPIQRRFRLKSIGFDADANGAMSVELSVNPEKWYTLGDLVAQKSTKLRDDVAMPIKTELKFRTDRPTNFGDEVGVEMEAKPLAPDHPEGFGPRDSHLKNVMSKLVTEQAEGSPSAENYVKGHLLNADIGGPGTRENLFPITGQANSNHYQEIERWIVNFVKNGFYVYYHVLITINGTNLGDDPAKNYIKADLRAKGGLWHVDGTHPHDREVVIQSISPNAGRSARSAEDLPLPRGSDDTQHAERMVDVSSLDSRDKQLEHAKAAADARDAVGQFLDLVQNARRLTTEAAARGSLDTLSRDLEELADGAAEDATNAAHEASEAAKLYTSASEKVGTEAADARREALRRRNSAKAFREEAERKAVAAQSKTAPVLPTIAERLLAEVRAQDTPRSARRDALKTTLIGEQAALSDGSNGLQKLMQRVQNEFGEDSVDDVLWSEWFKSKGGKGTPDTMDKAWRTSFESAETSLSELKATKASVAGSTQVQPALLSSMERANKFVGGVDAEFAKFESQADALSKEYAERAARQQSLIEGLGRMLRDKPDTDTLAALREQMATLAKQLRDDFTPENG